MSKLEELIKEFCPNGVEYKKLGELGKFYGGLSGKSKNDFANGNEKFITYKNVYANPSLNLDVEDRVKINPRERQNTLQYGDIIFTGSSETPDECGFSSVITTKTSEKLYLNSFCFFFRLDNQSILLPDFAKHLFRAESIRYQIGKTASGVTRYNVSKDKMKQVQIPLPALPVQREIVRVLDSFTLYSAELTAELTARRKQYEFYRDKLLNFANQQMKVRMCSMGDLGKFYGGISGKTKDDFKDGNAKFISYKNVYFNPALNTNIDEKVKIGINEHQRTLEYGDIIFTGSSETPDECGLSSVVTETVNEKLYLNSFCFFFRFDNKKMILPGFAKYLFRSTEIRRQIVKTASGVTRYNVSKEKMAKVQIPLPPMDVQERIVKVLDNFDAICSDLGIGLPAEIEKRQKQYEYYRDKLLTFEGKNNNGEK